MQRLLSPRGSVTHTTWQLSPPFYFIMSSMCRVQCEVRSVDTGVFLLTMRMHDTLRGYEQLPQRRDIIK